MKVKISIEEGLTEFQLDAVNKSEEHLIGILNHKDKAEVVIENDGKRVTFVVDKRPKDSMKGYDPPA